MSKVVLEAVERLTEALTPTEKFQLYQRVAYETRQERLEALVKRVRRQAARHPISDRELKRACDEVRQELYEERTKHRH